MLFIHPAKMLFISHGGVYAPISKALRRGVTYLPTSLHDPAAFLLLLYRDLQIQTSKFTIHTFIKPCQIFIPHPQGFYRDPTLRSLHLKLIFKINIQILCETRFRGGKGNKDTPSRRRETFNCMFLHHWFGLVWFYGISTFVGYLTPNPFLCK